MIINAQFDSSTTGAPAGFFTAVNAAVAYWEHEIVNPLTVTIVFGYNSVHGQTIGANALAESESSGFNDTYGQVVSGLTFAGNSANDASAIAHLPASDPSSGAGFYVPLAEAEVFGQFSTANTIVGYAGLSSAFPFTFDPNNRAAPGEYDAIGAMEHEISEVLGRIAGSGVMVGGVAQFSPLDLFRYASAGNLAVTPEGASFSINGSNLLLPFNNPGMNGQNGDAGDWASPPVFGDSFGSGSKDTAGLVSATDLTVMDVLGYSLATTKNDFNGDGSSDILLRNTDGSVALFNTNGGGGFTGFTSLGLGVVPTSWSIQQVGDFNGDGVDGVLWRNSSGEVAFWQSNAGAGFTGFSSTDLGVVATNWTIEQVGDFNGDGKDDILWRNTAGDTALWLSKSGAGFTGITSVDLGIISTSQSIQSVGDFNGDGKDDILWRNSSSGDVSFWLSNSGTGYTGVTIADIGVVPTSWTIQQVGDFNGDSKADILWRNSNGDVALWLSNATAGFSGFTVQDLGVIPANWVIQGVGDYNSDGKDDILWRNTNGDVAVWLSNAGAGFTGFTIQDLGVVATSWSIAGDSPPPLGSTPGSQAIASAAPSAASASPPSLSNTGGTVSYHAGGAAAHVAHQLQIADLSSSTLVSATVAISSGLLAGDLLNVASQRGIASSYNAANGVLTLTGEASLAAYQHALDSISYSSSAADPTHGGADAARQITITVDDGVHGSSSLESSLTVTEPFLANLHAHSDFTLFG
jgi:hypothetical protein